MAGIHAHRFLEQGRASHSCCGSWRGGRSTEGTQALAQREAFNYAPASWPSLPMCSSFEDQTGAARWRRMHRWMRSPGQKHYCAGARKITNNDTKDGMNLDLFGLEGRVALVRHSRGSAGHRPGLGRGGANIVGVSRGQSNETALLSSARARYAHPATWARRPLPNWIILLSRPSCRWGRIDILLMAASSASVARVS